MFVQCIIVFRFLPELFQIIHLQVSGRLSELKTTIDAGQLHRDNLLNTIGAQFEQWDVLVCQKLKLALFCIIHVMN